MRVFVSTSYRQITIYTEEEVEEQDRSGRSYSRRHRTYRANLRIDHELREKSVLKFMENAKIVGFGKGRGGDMEIELENGDKLKKLENILQVKIIYKEVKDVLRGYSEGDMTLEDAYVQLLPYVVARKLIKT